jgi:hypothetical protein
MQTPGTLKHMDRERAHHHQDIDIRSAGNEISSGGAAKEKNTFPISMPIFLKLCQIFFKYVPHIFGQIE